MKNFERLFKLKFKFKKFNFFIYSLIALNYTSVSQLPNKIV